MNWEEKFKSAFCFPLWWAAFAGLSHNFSANPLLPSVLYFVATIHFIVNVTLWISGYKPKEKPSIVSDFTTIIPAKNLEED